MYSNVIYYSELCGIIIGKKYNLYKNKKTTTEVCCFRSPQVVAAQGTGSSANYLGGLMHAL